MARSGKIDTTRHVHQLIGLNSSLPFLLTANPLAPEYCGRLMRIDEDFAEVHFYLQSHVVEVDSRPSCYIFADGGSPQEYIAMNLGRPILTF